MGTVYCKCEKSEEKNSSSCFSALFSRLSRKKRNRVIPISLRPQSAAIVRNEIPVAEMVEVVSSADEVSGDDKVAVDTRNKKVRPKGARLQRSISPIIPTCVKELDDDVNKLLAGHSDSECELKKPRPKAAKGRRTEMIVHFEFVDPNEIVLPGVVVPSSDTVEMKIPSRPQLTVPAIKTEQQRHLDDWMARQTQAGRDLD